MTLLLTLLFIKHFLADFVFQTEWMVKGKGLESGWLLPLYCHASVHQIFTLAILFFYVDISTAIVVAFLEKVAHIIIDRTKASPSLLGRYKDISRPAFWNALGADQLAHALTYIAIATYVI
jgi:hypothetical protein